MTRMIGCMECGDWFPLDPEYPHVNMCPPCHDRYPLPPRRVEQPVYVAPTPVERKARYSPPVVPRTGTGRPNVTRAVPCGTCGRLLVGDAGKTDAHGVRYCGTLCLAAVVFVPQSRKAAQPAVTPPARPTTVRAARTPRTCVGPSLDPGVMCGRPLEGRQRLYCSRACESAAYRLLQSAPEPVTSARPCAGPGCTFTAAVGSSYCDSGGACRQRASRARRKVAAP